MQVYHAPRDADLLIDQKAVKSGTMESTVLVVDDTDLFVLLCYQLNPKNTKNPKVWNIKAMQQQLGHDICTNILFLHAVL